MGRVTLELESLSEREIERVERLLSVENRARVAKAFIRSIAADLKRERITLKIGSSKSLHGAVAHWKQKVLLARNFRGKTIWKPEAYVKCATRARIVDQGKKAIVELDVALTAEYFQWLLVRAIRNSQIAHFIFCDYCGGVRYKRIIRKDIRFCIDDHRSQFHYRQTRQGAKDLLKSIRKQRPDGWPFCMQDILILREHGIKPGTKEASKLLMRSSFPIENLDEVERKTFSDDFQTPERDLASSSHTVLYIRRNKRTVIISAGEIKESSAGGSQLTRRIWHGRVLAAFIGHESDANPLLTHLENELEKSEGDLVTAAHQLSKKWHADPKLYRRDPKLVVADRKSAVLMQFNSTPIEAKDDVCAVGLYGDFVEGAAISLFNQTGLVAKEIARKSMNILRTRKEIIGGTLSIKEL